MRLAGLQGVRRRRGLVLTTRHGTGQGDVPDPVKRRFMAEKSIAQIVIFLTVATTALSLPIIGMFANGEISHDRLYTHTGVLLLFV